MDKKGLHFFNAVVLGAFQFGNKAPLSLKHFTSKTTLFNKEHIDYIPFSSLWGKIEEEDIFH